MAMLLNRQKPMPRSGVAWWPGGRTIQKAFFASLAITRSTACRQTPVACVAALKERGEMSVSPVLN